MISVVIACLDGADTLEDALQSLVDQGYAGDWEIILADNGSRDASREIFRAMAARHPQRKMRLIDASDLRGKSHALNRGIAEADGDRLAFLDADDTLAPGWLAAMAAALERHDFVAARVDILALNPRWAAAVRPNPQQTRLMVLTHAPFCAFAGGATLGLHRAVFDAVGGFDTAMMCFEDVDFCIRAHQCGFTLQYAPDAIYNYRFRSSPDGIRRQSDAYARARLQLRKRYGRSRSVFSPGPWLALAAEFGALGLWRLAQAPRGRLSAKDAAWFHHRLGTAHGNAAGALAHRAAPASPGLRGLRRWVSLKAASVLPRALAPWYGSTMSARTSQRVMALTFDDGPDPATTPALLDTLARLGARATFFVVGSRAERYPDLIARIAAEGHEIGNHSWSHPSLPTLSSAEITTQIDRTRAALGPLGRTLLRPPYGDQDFRTNRIARRFGYRVVLWSISGADWMGHDAAALADRIVGQAAPGAIVLLHDSLCSFENAAYCDRSPTIEAVAKVVEALPDYAFVTVSELLAQGLPVVRVRTKVSTRGYLNSLGSAILPQGDATLDMRTG